MEVLLRVWDVALDIARFDTSTGTAVYIHTKTMEEAKSYRCAGYIHRDEKGVAAVYSMDDTIYFQHGSKRWDLGNPNVKLSWFQRNLDKSNVFLVYVENVIALKVAYCVDGWLRRVDPIYDTIDEEQEDFFLWLTRCFRGKTWVRDVTRGWANGI
jgi:hypothetical protein